MSTTTSFDRISITVPSTISPAEKLVWLFAKASSIVSISCESFVKNKATKPALP